MRATAIPAHAKKRLLAHKGGDQESDSENKSGDRTKVHQTDTTHGLFACGQIYRDRAAAESCRDQEWDQTPEDQ
jgi:hypothetical protein